MEQAPELYKWIRQRTYEWHREHPIFVELIEHPLVMEFATAWLGGDFHLIAAQCSRNTREDPYAPGAMNIHQDTCFFPLQERRRPDVPEHRYGFSAMWYLQDTPLEMGPTEFVRGSHLTGHSHKDDELRSQEMDHGALDSPHLFRQAIPAGSLLLFNHRTRHRGAFNSMSQPRDLITNAYARPEVDKVQLTTPSGDGQSRYAPCEDLMASATPTIRRLLEERL